MATSTPILDTEAAGKEPGKRTITRELPNLRNRAIADEYRRQRTILHDAAPSQRSEMDFWEAGSLLKAGVERGDLVLVAPPGEFGKPRPALIIQSDAASPSGYFTHLPIASTLLRVLCIRVPVAPTPANGLHLPSEVMADMIQTPSQARSDRALESSNQLYCGLSRKRCFCT